MSCALDRNGRATLRRRGRGRRIDGFTLIEVLVAIAVVMIFFTGAVLSFTQMIKASDRAQARLEALSNARHALDTMSTEFKRARLLPDTSGSQLLLQEYFLATRTELVSGDRIDNDRDGVVDEEINDAQDNDGDWTAASDRHALIPAAATATSGSVTYSERPRYRGLPDLGDAKVDEDTRFSSSTVSFETFPVPGQAGTRRVTFTLGPDPDGEPGQALLMSTETTSTVGGVATVGGSGPAAIAYNVLSFAPLFYRADAGTTATTPYQTTWSTGSTDPTIDPVQRNTVPAIPASVYLSLTVYSGTPRALQEVLGSAAGQIETMTFQTVVDIEAVLNDPRYDSNLRDGMTALLP